MGFSGAVLGVDPAQYANNLRLQNEARQNKATQYDAVANNIRTILQNGYDPTEPPDAQGNRKPLSDDQRASLSNVLNTVQTYRNSVFNPKVDPNTGQPITSPMRAITDKLHITKKAPAQQMADLGGIVARYGGEIPNNPFVAERRMLQEAGLTPEQIDAAIAAKAGLFGGGNSDFQRYLVSYARNLGLLPYQLSPDQIQEAHRSFSGSGRAAKEAVVPDAGSSTGWSKIGYDQQGKEVYRVQDVKPAINARHGWGHDEKGWYSFNADPTTNQEVPGTRNYGQVPPVNILNAAGTQRTGMHFFVDDAGNVTKVPYTTTTKPLSGVAPGAGVNPTGINPKGAVNPPVSIETKTPGVIVGKTTSPEDKLVAADALKAASDARKQVNLLDTATEYVNGVNSGTIQPDSAKDLALIVQAVRAMNPGTVRLPTTEITLELKRGTYGQQFQRWYKSKIESGTLPVQYRNELFGVINDETSSVAKDAAKNWSQVFQGRRPLPPHLQRFAETPQAGGEQAGGAPTGPRKVSLRKAMALPQNQGKSREEIITDIKAHGYQPVEDDK